MPPPAMDPTQGTPKTPPNPLLLSYIFIRIFWLLLDTDVILPPPPNHPHFVLSSVCRVWREVIVSIPAFWNRYIFHATLFSHPRERINVVKSFIERSNSYPLSFAFRTNLDQRIGQTIATLPLADLLFGAGEISIVNEFIFPNYPRLVNLECLLYGAEISRLLLNVPLGGFQFLEVLDITFLNTYADNPLHYSIPHCLSFRPFESIPSLRRVTCQIVDAQIHPLDLRLPLAQLTKFHLKAVLIPPDLFLRIMRLCSLALMDASFSIEFDLRWIGRYPHYIQPVEMPALIRLHLRLMNLSYDPTFPLLLHLPNLRHLWIEEADANFPFSRDFELYRALAWGSAWSLETLRLTDLPVNADTGLPINADPAVFLHRQSSPRSTSHVVLEELLGTIPNVKRLSLPLSVYVHHTTLSKVARGTLLPFLEVLELGTQTDASIVFNMIRARNEFDSSSQRQRIPSPIEYLSLFVPTTTHHMEAQITQAATSLGLACGGNIWFIPRCRKEKCDSHCCFAY